MYIRKSIRSYKGATYTNYVLVESVHTAKGPRQRAICSLSDLSPRPAADWLKLARKIEDALVGQADLLDPDNGEVANIVRRVRERREAEADSAAARAASPHVELINIDPSRVSTERHREAGPVHVGYQFWRRLELDRILAGCGLSETVRRLSCAMTLNRLIAPCSEHAMPDWIRRSAIFSASTSIDLPKTRSTRCSIKCIRCAPRSRRRSWRASVVCSTSTPRSIFTI